MFNAELFYFRDVIVW